MKTGLQMISLGCVAFRRLGGSHFLMTMLAVGLASARAQAGGTNFTLLGSFPSNGGANPKAELTQTSDGTLYGTTYSGGTYNAGTVFSLGPIPASVAANSQTPSALFSFGGTVPATNPYSPLTLVGTNFYGTTYGGGAYGYGALFMVSNGVPVILASFDGANGSGPQGPLLFYSNKLYGTTYGGGAFGYGTVFVEADGVVTALASFDGLSHGSRPSGGVAMGYDGNLYGTTAAGGTNDYGTLFMCATTKTRVLPLTLYFFSGGIDGASPQAGLVLGPDQQTLYGATVSGGTNNSGAVFSLFAYITNGQPNVTVTALSSFGGAKGSGSNCWSRLLLGIDGNFYGTTRNGGAYNQGTVFSCSTSGALAYLYSFRGGSLGGSPQSGLIQNANGTLYGVTPTGGASSFGTVFQLAGFAPYIVTQPTGITILTNSNGALEVTASGTPPLTYHWRKNSNDIGNSSLYSGVNTPVLTLHTGNTVSTNSYDVWVENPYGAATSSVVQVIVANTFGSNAPIVKIISPSVSRSTTIPTTTLNLKVSGTALTDSLSSLAEVWYQLNNTGWQQATTSATTKGNQAKWSAAVILKAGTNVFQVYAVDASGQSSLTNAAYFVPNQYVLVAGSYTGLFYDTNGVVTPTNAGLFNLSVTTAGGYSGKLQMGGASYSFSGKLTNGAAQTTAKQGKSSVRVSLLVDLTNNTDRVFGVISNGTWQATLDGDRAVFDGKNLICPQYGRYNFTFSGTNLTLGLTNLTLAGANFALPGINSSNQPAAGSFGTITVSKAGKIAFAASLSDGTTFSQSAPVSKTGLWPLYASLYKGQGLVWSWQSFPSTALGNFAGDLAWLKPPLAKSKYYPDGFMLRATPLGSAFPTLVKGENVFGLSTTNPSTLIVIGSELPGGITNAISISPKNRVSNLGTEVTKLSLSFSTTPGTFSGKFTPTAGGQAVSFRGVVLENTNSTGFFLGTNQQSGQVWITSP